MNDARSDSDDENEIFDGNKTPDKELSMSEGIFFNIVIHDNKTIDAKYRFNRPITDNYAHYFRPSTNQFIEKLMQLGFKFGTLDCGLKIGSETSEAWSYQNVPKKYLPQ